MELRDTARAADGRELAVTRFPAEGEARGAALVLGAMGVRQDFYAPFARYLAEGGFHALTFDYRGMGWSQEGSLRGFEATVLDWALKDANAMLAEARAAAPGRPVVAVGHSLGGQILGVLPDNTAIRAALTVTAGSGWYRHNDRMPLRVRFFWFAAIPLLTPLFGYFPGKALRMVGDLPRGVASQWRRWCLHPDYLLGEDASLRAGFDRVRFPIRGYSFADDDIVTRPAVDRLHGFYRHAPVERLHLAPGDLGEKRVGHFGFFAAKSRPTLWKAARDWLAAAAAPR